VTDKRFELIARLAAEEKDPQKYQAILDEINRMQSKISRSRRASKERELGYLKSRRKKDSVR